MISIIICSRNSDIPDSLRKNIDSTIGVEHEINVIDNYNNDFSIFSAYNKGYEMSKFPYLCFVHEDVHFRTENWGVNLINHLSDEKTGIIGVAGGKMVTKVPASWAAEGRYIHLVQHHNGEKILLKDPTSFSGSKQPAIWLDGLFLAMRKDLFNSIKFDENLTGFHGYDLDISMQSIVAGFSNFVVYDILLEHFSEGNKDIIYYKNLISIYQKWEKALPVFSQDVSEKGQQNLKKIETTRLAKLIRRLARVRFENDEIRALAEFYSTLLGLKGLKKQSNFLQLKILFEKIFNS